MKAKITKPDGTVIDAEGSAEEIRSLLAPMAMPLLPDRGRYAAPMVCFHEYPSTSGYCGKCGQQQSVIVSES